MVNKKRVEQCFVDLVSINSPSRQEGNLVSFLKTKLEAIGFEVEEDAAASVIGGEAGNLIAFLPGSVSSAPALMLSCHLDTVEPTDGLKLETIDGIFRSDGTTILGADDKAGIAAVIEGVQSVIESGAAHGDVQVVFSVAEEIGLLGAKSLNRSKLIGKFGYVFDTEKPVGGITVSAPSHESLTVLIRGRAAHAGMAPEKGVSAIVAASRAISKMRLGRIDEETTANVGVIEGGKARNIVPDLVTVRAEARSRNESSLLAQVRHMTEMFEREACAIGAQAEVAGEREYTGFRWCDEDEVVKIAVAAANRMGICPVFVHGGGGSDANIFNAWGIPSVVVGVGYEDAHSSSERITCEDLCKAAEFAASLLLTAADWRQ